MSKNYFGTLSLSAYRGIVACLQPRLVQASPLKWLSRSLDIEPGVIRETSIDLTNDGLAWVLGSGRE